MMESTSTSGTQTPTSISSSATQETSTSSVSDSETTPVFRVKALDFSTIHQLFPDHSSSPLWYILTTAVLLSFHKEKLTGDLWTYLSSSASSSDSESRNEDDLLAIARRIRESCLKASTLVGFPRVRNQYPFRDFLRQAYELTCLLPAPGHQRSLFAVYINQHHEPNTLKHPSIRHIVTRPS